MLAALLLICLPLPPQGEVVRETRPDGTRIEREVTPGPDGGLVNEGAYKEYWPNGNPKVDGRYFKGLRHGPWRTWHPTGERESAGSYRKGLREGDWTVWRSDGEVVAEESGEFKVLALEYPDGAPRSIGEMRRGVRHGAWTFYWDNGCEKAFGRYADGWLSGPWAFRHPDGTFDPEWISGVYEHGQRKAPLSPEARIEAVRRQPTIAAPRSGSAAVAVRQLLSRLRQGDPSRLDKTLAELRGSASDPAFLSELLVQLDPDTESEERLAQELWREHLKPGWGSDESLRLWWPAGENADSASRRLERLRWATLARLKSPELLCWRVPIERRVWMFGIFKASEASKTAYQPRPLEPIVHLPLDDGLPETQTVADSPYRKRLEKRGKGPERQALDRALLWLREHQSVDGSWDADGFSERCAGSTCEGPGAPLSDVGVTALALLAFLGDGHSSRHGDFRETVARGLLWLRDNQDPETGNVGEIQDFTWVYGHAAATLALCEALVFAEDPHLRTAAQKAVACILRARNPGGGWRYGTTPDGSNDTSVTGWMIAALHAARIAAIPADYDPAFAGALSFIDSVTDQASGRVGYSHFGEPSSRLPTNEHFPREKGEAMTAVGLLCRILLGQRPEAHPILKKHAELIRSKPPVWEPNGYGIDTYYWYYGTYALQFLGKPYWPVWEKAMKAALLDSQRLDGHAVGSWDPIDVWGFVGGRVYTTALMALCLEAPRRLVLSDAR